jgi:single-stranded DNA-binding protein
MAIYVVASGRLAAQPELQAIGNNGNVKTEFRLLCGRKNAVTEAISFFAFGDDAIRLCENAVKGQEIECSGHQETSHFTGSDQQPRTYVRYRLTHFTLGYKPRVQSDQTDGEAGGARNNYRDQSQSYQPRRQEQGPAAQPTRQAHRPTPVPASEQQASDNDWIDD